MRYADNFLSISIEVSRILLLAGMGLATAGLASSRADAQALLQPDVTGSSPSYHEGFIDPDAKDDSQYSDGTKAIHEGRWADAEAIFARLVLQHGAHSDGAYYWKAYAENKQGNSAGALKTCAELRQVFQHSQWNEECNALTVEIGGGQPATASSGSEQDEIARLREIDALMRKDQARALGEIQSILGGDQPESFKERALFLLVADNSQAARQILLATANSSANPMLQARARQIVAALQNQGAAGRHHVVLDLVVTDGSGKPVTGLTAQDFTIRDNKQPATIEGFTANDGKAASGTGSGTGIDSSSQVIILIDAVNASLTETAYERQQVMDYLRRDHGHLGRPVTVLLFDGSGVEKIGVPSLDGNALADAVAQADASLHQFRKSQGFYGAEDRVQFSLDGLNSIASQEAKQPGRKLLLWISPGWPLLPWSDFDSGQRRQEALFGEIVALTNNLRLAQITLFSIDPNVTAGADLAEWNRYKDYRKPVLSADRAQLGNLALQVFAEHSAGRAMTFSKDFLSTELAQCAAEAEAPYYTIQLLAPVAKRKNEFHAITVTVNRPGLTVKTNHGYYNQP